MIEAEEEELEVMAIQGMMIENEAERDEDDKDDYGREMAIAEGEGMTHKLCSNFVYYITLKR